MLVREEIEWRANTYNLLAGLLSAPPTDKVLSTLSQIGGKSPDPANKPLSAAWIAVAKSAHSATSKAIHDEYQTLFIGITRGEIIPYASWYVSGFLMEKPLANIRRDLNIMGIKRCKNTHEPEDHVAALFEVMTLLIQDNNEAHIAFFKNHIEPWINRLFHDIAYAQSADFYRSIAQLGIAFMTLEKNLLELH